ncbi:MAG: ribonuclease III [Elusimicrobia bacterium GWA2_56_46]|nr:MAG: ribonuclease III [Elusimicrobia bacterium GWA2_56_46]OGR55684.1 MAG: ribonuclease III [Elusimicrobia bacterium GWC2_56_31]HBB66520.1 ribonuclease III [Elusimicrobiota bacterium]HBW23560.1 ribonuclease III [Elusimicrobiota bacterium]
MDSIERAIGYTFRNKELLREALTHKSFSTERDRAGHNERLEFLGDSVLGLIVSCYLFNEHPAQDEGYLSKVKSVLVSRANLADWAAALNLGEHVFLGAGEHQTGGKKRGSILSNCLEALIGAIYLDGGLKPAAEFVECRLHAQDMGGMEEQDYKSVLQEVIQKRHKKPPEYEIMTTEGPEHDKVFTVRVRIGKKTLGMGSGRNKKEAQQAAAKTALDYLENHEIHP